MVENKAFAAVFVLTLAGQLGFLSTVLKDRLMIGIGIATIPNFDALRQLLSRFWK